MSLVGILVVLGFGLFFGVDVTPFLQSAGEPTATGPAELSPADERAASFVSVTLADTEEIWAEIFAEQFGVDYTPAVLVLYKDITRSPRGNASGATGPFYCPTDRKVYLDTSFIVTLERRLGAGGDFAAAYVVAHEVTHHVQNELGILGEADRIRAQAGETEANAISVRIELQADCLSGIWAARVDQAFGSLEQGDVAEAMNAAKRIGDDMLQRNAGRVPMPESFKHGTSEQRQRWFARGFRRGQTSDWDTFSRPDL